MTTPDGKIRVLIAPCGCMSAADITTTLPGFCRSNKEAAEDLRNGYIEKRIDRDEYRATPMDCQHEPKWGVA